MRKQWYNIVKTVKYRSNGLYTGMEQSQNTAVE